MRTSLCVAMAMIILTTAAASVGAGDENDFSEERTLQHPNTMEPVDEIEIYELQASFHRATGAKDLHLMMSLWANDATLTTGGHTYRGKSAIRAWFRSIAGSFRPQNSWVSLTPLQKVRIRLGVQLNRASLYFECHYVDVKTGEVRSRIAADATLIRSRGMWLIENLTASPANLSQ